MILWHQDDGSVLATPQPAHALISGQLARALAVRPEPFEPVCVAAANHDVAWMPWEAAPEIDATTGLPRHFNHFTGDQHVALWERGVDLALANWGLWVGLLVLRHGSHIYRLGILHDRMAPGPDSRAAMEGYIAREAARGAALMARLGVEEAQVAAASRVVALVDAIALGLCWGQREFDCGGMMLRRTGDFSAVLDPWPLAGDALVVETECLVLRPPVADAVALQAAPRRPLRFDLSRP